MLKTATNSINASQIQTPITLPGDVTLSTGNLVIGTSGKGIDFSATPGTGTSELLSDYEEGTFTPVLNAFTIVLGGGTVTTSGRYTKVGRLVTVEVLITCAGGATIAAANGAGSYISGLPFVQAVATTGSWVNRTSIADFGGILGNFGLLYMTNGWGAVSNTFCVSSTYSV